MKMIKILLSAILLLLSVPGTIIAKDSFKVGKGCFLLNDKPFVVKAAELHYPRIPRPYWEHRIKLCKALGMNTVCLYTFWNVHEPRQDKFDFSGNNDLREFINLCGKNDMKVILRPGPYVCAEWEMGGLPWWLLKKEDIRLREDDSLFMERVEKFEKEVSRQVGDLTVDNGGPIIMVQVENEYGSYGTDKEYIRKIRDILRRYFGNKVTMFQCDWSSNFLNNGLDDLVWTINFGTGADISREFAPLRMVRPDAPLMCSEFWSGWFDKWGANHETRPADDMIAGIDEMLRNNISFSLYMTHGGTNWGHWAGANSPGFAPDVTSYDYDAPISEQGAVTPKYTKLRNILAKYTAEGSLPPVPAPVPADTIPPFSFTEVAPLWQNLPEPKQDTCFRSMEHYDQGFGSIIYRTLLPAFADSALLTIINPHDYAQVFIDGRHTGTLDRRLGENTLHIPPCPAGAQLDIFIEAMGRINFGRAIKDFKGVTDSVTLTFSTPCGPHSVSLANREVYNIVDDYATYKAMRYRPITGDDANRYPAGAYRAVFIVDKPADTFLDFSSWGKGLVYVNGHPLGRIWSIGPQQTLYMPGCWLKEGENEIVVFDVEGPRKPTSTGRRHPVLDKLRLPATAGRSLNAPDLAGLFPVAKGAFIPGNGWQKLAFPAAEGRYFCMEALDAVDGDDKAAIAEIILLDDKDNRIPRENWKVVYADSEETEKANCSAEKIFDLQESTFWQTAHGTGFPHTLVIDMGNSYSVTGMLYLPRMEKGAPGAISNYRLYISPTPFPARQANN